MIKILKYIIYSSDKKKPIFKAFSISYTPYVISFGNTLNVYNRSYTYRPINITTLGPNAN